MDQGSESPQSVTLTEDEKTAIRGFLQRCEVRLSTLHRVATALLSGAGLLILLPAVARDSIVTVIHALLNSPRTFSNVLLILTMSLEVTLVLVLIWLVMHQLTMFYFHTNHIKSDSNENFVPRFTLTSHRLPLDEIGPEATVEYNHLRQQQHNISLIVPPNDRTRRRVDHQIAAYPALGLSAQPTDQDRAEGLMRLTSASRRSLVDEVVKVEYGMARHISRLQVVVLRYVKALLVVVLTVVAAYVSSAALNHGGAAVDTDAIWIAVTMAIWAPLVILAATAPVRWIEQLLRSEGATTSSVSRNPGFTRAEDVAGSIATSAWLMSAIVLAIVVASSNYTDSGRIFAGISLGFSTVLFVVALIKWHPYK